MKVPADADETVRRGPALYTDGNVFKRKPVPAAPPAPAPAASTGESDVSRVLAELLARPTQESVLDGALAYTASLVGGRVHGLGILRRGQDRVGAVLGYPRDLMGVTLSGPWSAGRMRLLEGARANCTTRTART